jgi:hypothetical protein
MSNVPTIKFEVVPSPEFYRQMELLKVYPEIFDKWFYPAMEQAAEVVKDAVRPNIPVHTGQLGRALGSKVVHSKTLGTSAHIGFGKRYGMPSAPYAPAVEAGSPSHEVSARRTEDGYLHFSSQGRFTAIQSVTVPGFSGFGMLDKGLQNATPAVNALMDGAAAMVLQELATP